MAQNRVTPFGTIESLPGRGTLMGNRGILHVDGQITRRWASKAWITCVLEFKGWRAAQWEPGHYTPLFFLDEATALAAGHRPCALCRRADHRRFGAAWGDAPLKDLDATLHGERTGERPTVRTSGLPDGAMVAVDGIAHLVLDGEVLPWSDSGYGDRVTPPRQATLLTPPSNVAAIRNGYVPMLHPTASPAEPPRSR